MADIDAVFNDDDFFTEIDSPKTNETTPKPKWTPFADGEYLGHISELNTREVSTHKGKHKAIVYNFKVKVDEANSANNYTYQWGNTEYNAKGEEYVGKVVNARGVFKYLVPKEGDDFQSNPDGNKTYTYFCEALGIELPVITKEINGENVRVKTLPTLEENHILGAPVIAVVGKGRPYTNNNGKEVTPSEVKFVKAWKQGTKMEDASEADIPF